MNKNTDVTKASIPEVSDRLTLIFTASYAAQSEGEGLDFYPTRTLIIDTDPMQSAGKKYFSETKSQIGSQFALVMNDYHDVYSCLRKLNIKGLNDILEELTKAEDYIGTIRSDVLLSWKEFREIGRKAIKKRLSLCRPELREHLPQDKIKRLISQGDFPTIIENLKQWKTHAKLLANALQVCNAQDGAVVQVDKKIRRNVRESRSFKGSKFAASAQHLMTGEVDRLQRQLNPNDPSHRTSFNDKMMVALVGHVPVKNIWLDTIELKTVPNTVEFFDAIVALGKLHSGQSVRVPAAVVDRLFTEIRALELNPECEAGDIKSARELIKGYFVALVDQSETAAAATALENGATEVVIRPRLDVIDQRILS